ncbi:hypothetical protein HMPREF9374_2764 [Desmospora sp. 8437]|nr:hypothetical protein HMPREF9374_2764 [Desmospora sp. 8437]
MDLEVAQLQIHTHKGVPMKQDTILFDLLQSFLPLDEIAQKQGYQDTARKFSFRDLLCFWIASSVDGWKGFRHSEKQLRTIPALPSVDHSTLSKKASDVPYTLLKEVLDRLIQCCNRSTRRSLSLPEPVFALDSTTVTVGKGCLPWARFRGEKSGVKLHVRLDIWRMMPWLRWKPRWLRFMILRSLPNF